MSKEILFDRIEKKLQENEGVVYAGKVIKLSKQTTFPEMGFFYVAPADTLTRVDELNMFMDGILSDPSLPTPYKQSAYLQGRALRIGYLEYDEDIATIIEKHESTITSDEPEALARIGMTPGVTSKETVSHIQRRGIVRVYPDEFFAKNVMEYKTEERYKWLRKQDIMYQKENFVTAKDMNALRRRNLRVIT